ncbi:ABC transporter substrate-binding protein [Streptomyces sp. NBC_01176]|uniref:ABC transporter substrate-binding protein n=1 Tax=Streptomyces sp. NBC_01176 TaxID=2903760 RepID=UPI002F9134D3|nr:ABC transporter substrate-binding protein [Streptomyces sp. NBC_01176]
MNRKTLVLPAVAGLLAPVLAACGGADSGGGAIVVGTTDRFIASKNAPAPLDPAYAYDVGTWNILRQTVQSLMTQPKGGGNPVPDAAEECGFTDTGNERYACTLRKGLEFADGTPVTAAAVKYSIDRVRAIRADSGVFGLLSTIDTVETQGASEVVFHLNTADATLPFKLSTPVAGIVHPRKYAKNRLRNGFSVDGSGPYVLDADVSKGEMTDAVFTKNPRYKGAVTLNNDKVELRSFADSHAMGAALAEGGIDVMSRTMSPEQIRKFSDTGDGSIDLVETPGLDIQFLGFNTEAATVRSRAVRRAMAQLVDRSELVAKVYGTQAEPLYSIIPATITGHSNSFFNKYGEPSVAKARAILAKAAITTPVKLTLHYTTDHYGPATGKEFKILQRQLNASGLFNVSVQGTRWGGFRPAESKGAYDVYGLGWFPDFPDADTYVAPFLDKDNTLNSPYVNSEIRHVLLPRTRRETNRLDAVGSLTRIQDIVADDVPILPLWQGKQYIAARDGITGTAYAINSSAALSLWELKRGRKS